MLKPEFVFRSHSVRTWLRAAFPQGPTPIQARSWPIIASGKHALLIAPTGTGKTLAATLPLFDSLFLDVAKRSGAGSGTRILYVAPLRSLANDIAKNLSAIIGAIPQPTRTGLAPLNVAVRTGDTSARLRRLQRLSPPNVLVTTPESLALLLSQPVYREQWRNIEHIIIDEIHELMPTKRGADLTLSLERLASKAGRDPQRVGLSATCANAEAVGRFLVGPDRECVVCEVAEEANRMPLELKIESLAQLGRPPGHARLVTSLRRAMRGSGTTIVFANTRALAEKLAFDLTARLEAGEASVAVHHSAIDAKLRSKVERGLKDGTLRGVITSTSLELGVDFPGAELSVMVGPPSSVSRCLQRVGRSGHQRCAARRGLILASSPVELLAGLAGIAAAREGRTEPLACMRSPLDVLCQQLLGMACAGDCSEDEAFALVRRSWVFKTLERAAFDDCLTFLSGQNPSVERASRTSRWGPSRIRRRAGRFQVRGQRVMRWLWMNIGTIYAEEAMTVAAGGIRLGTVEAAFAERLQVGDRFILDGRGFVVVKVELNTVRVEPRGGTTAAPRWTSERMAMSRELAEDVANLRETASAMLAGEGSAAVREWLKREHALDDSAAQELLDLVEAQWRHSEPPPRRGILVEQYSDSGDTVFAFHAALGRRACEVIARATSVRVGRLVRCNLSLCVGDLGWSIRVPGEFELGRTELRSLLASAGLEDDLIAGLETGELLGREFRRVASTALMVLRNAEGGRMRVGGMSWVSRRLFPLLSKMCPAHPLIRETKRSVLEDLFDIATARAFLETSPEVRFRQLSHVSPFAAAWIEPTLDETQSFESPADALTRLHQRLSNNLAYAS